MQQQYTGVGETFTFQEIDLKGVQKQVITGYISTKSIDKFNDLITDECLDDMLIQIKSGNIKMDLEHETIHENNLNINPIARIVDAKKDEKGIWVKAELNQSNPRFQEIWGSIKDGFLDAFSIAFKPLETATRYIQGKAVRILNKLKLINIGITGTPVNDDCKMDKIVLKAIQEFKEQDDTVEFDDLSDEELEIKHKYIKRTGSPGNYTYFYSNKEYEDYKKSKSKDGRKHSDETEEKIQEMHKEWAQEVRQIKEKEAGGEITKEESKKKISELTEKYKKESEKVESDDKEKPKESAKKILKDELGEVFSNFKEKYKKAVNVIGNNDPTASGMNEWKEKNIKKESINFLERQGIKEPKDESKEYNKLYTEIYTQLEEIVEEEDFGSATTSRERLAEDWVSDLREYKDEINKENKIRERMGLEKKALNTQSGLLGKQEDHISHSTSKEEDNKQMAEEIENKPIEQEQDANKQTETKNDEVQGNENSDNVQNDEKSEVETLTEELADVKAQLV